MKIFFKTFFLDFKRSLSDWKFYKEIEAGQHKFKISYALILALISAFVITIIFTVSLYTLLLPGARSFVNDRLSEDLVITLKSGELSINQPVPYRFQLSEEDRQKKDDEKVNFLVIDTNAPADLNSPSEYETYVFANKDTLIMEKSSNEIRAYPLKEFPDMTISRGTANDFLDGSYKFAWLIPIAVFIFMAVFNFIGLLITFVVAGFLLWVILKIASRSVRYADAVAISMYAYTFIFVIDLLLMFIHGSFGFGLSVLFTVLLGCLFTFIKTSASSMYES